MSYGVGGSNCSLQSSERKLKKTACVVDRPPFVWTLQNGTYNLTVTNVQNASIIATNRQISLTVFPALSYSDASTFSIDMPNRAVGASATITVRLNDLNGEPQTSPMSSISLYIDSKYEPV